MQGASLDELVDEYFAAAGLCNSSSLLRRVQRGIYFFKKTKIIIKQINNKLFCMPLHLSQQQQQQQQQHQRYIPLAQFFKQHGINLQPNNNKNNYNDYNYNNNYNHYNTRNNNSNYYNLEEELEE